MEISTLTNPASNTASTATQSAQDSVLTSDFETFLVMLTTQMQNQDPLEPMKSDELSVQLATFSGVEQQVRTNDLLEALAGQMDGSDLAQIAPWVGMEARSSAPVRYDGIPIEATFVPSSADDFVQGVVRSSFGNELFRTTIPSGERSFTWDGTGLPFGTPLDATYQVSVERFSQGELTGTDLAETYSAVREVRVENGASVLVLDGGSQVSSNEITALRAP